MTTTTETITPMHRMGAVINYLDSQPDWATHAELAEVRALLVGDMLVPTHVAVPAARLKWLNGVWLAAEVAAASMNPEHSRDALHSLRNQLAAEPKAAGL